jgi:hypothetical protein
LVSTALPCTDDKIAPVAAASLDLDDPREWRSTTLSLEPRLAEFVSVAPVGALRDTFVFYMNRDLISLSGALEMREYPNASNYAWEFCITDGTVEALIPTQAALAGGPQAVITPDVGASGNATIVRIAADNGDDWQELAGAQTTKIPADRPGSQPPDSAVAFLCGPSGPVLATASRTFEWQGASWKVHDATRPLGLAGYGALTDGTDVKIATADSNAIAVFRDGSWRVTQVIAPPKGVPTGFQIAPVGDRVVVLVPSTEDTTGPQQLRIVTP